VAREYGIPAVLGTGVATHRIQSGQNVRVDGDAGTVTLMDGEGESAAEPISAKPVSGAGDSSRNRRVALLGIAAGAVVTAAAWWRIRRRG
jgi:rifampicin phosphotransferase